MEEVIDKNKEMFIEKLFCTEDNEKQERFLSDNRKLVEEYKIDILRKAFTEKRNEVLIYIFNNINLEDVLTEWRRLRAWHSKLIYNELGINIEGLKLLLDKVDMNTFGLRLFDSWLKKKNPEAVQCYLDAGLKINDMHNDETPLMMLASCNFYKADEKSRSIEIAELLIKNNADPGLLNSEGKSAMDMALSRGNTALGSYLRKQMKFDIEEHIQKLKNNSLPDEVFEYLEKNRDNLVITYPKGYELSKLELCKIDEIRCGQAFISSWEYTNNRNVKDPNFKDDGNYYIDVIELVKYEENHNPNGILIWIPSIKQFGTCDVYHGVLYVFPDTGFNKIIEDKSYLNAQWLPSSKRSIKDIYKYCNPWEIWEYSASK